MTFSALRQLHAIIGDALDEIEGVYAAQTAFPEATSPGGGPSTSSPVCTTPRAGHAEPKREGDPKRKISSAFAYASPPPSPSVATTPQSFPPPFSDKAQITSTSTLLDFPSLDDPCDPFSLPEILTAQPTVLNAINRVVSAAGQMTAIVQAPFLTICDSTMGYHLPSCMRLLEASHVVEILREAGPGGLHVDLISKRNGVDPVKLAHTLRLLATHHILREVSPNVFGLNRISSLIDSGKLYAELDQYQADGRPELKYQGSNGIAAFVGLCTDEIQKASAYMTEAYHLAPSQSTREGREPTKAPFCFAFDTVKAKVGYFGWLEGAVEEDLRIDEADNGIEVGQGRFFGPVRSQNQGVPSLLEPYDPSQKRQSNVSSGSSSASEYSEPLDPVEPPIAKSNRFRLERFGKAMSGTESWETPGAVLTAFDWQSLPAGGTVVDVGGGIGSTTMLLASSFASAGARLKFVIQDRPPVIEMGQQAWRDKSPTLLNQSVTFQVHDFFTPQPVKDASVFLLRVVLHDWPYKYALRILQQLREAATRSTKLLIGDFILPLACYEDISRDPILEGIEGAERLFVPPPLLPNLGKANANVYWMDLTMQTMFNAQERTLREMAQLTLDAGWKIIKVATCTNSSFSYLTAIPIDHDAPDEVLATPVSVNPDLVPLQPEDATPQLLPASRYGKRKGEVTARRLERASSKRGTPTFGSRTELSSAFEDALAKIGNGFMKGRMGRGLSVSTLAPSPSLQEPEAIPALKPALTLTPKSAMKKQRSTTLSIVPPPASDTYHHQTSPTPGGKARRREATSPAKVSANGQQQRSPVPGLLKKCVSLAQMRLGGNTIGSSRNPGYLADPETAEIPSLPPFSFNPSSSSSVSERGELGHPVSTCQAEGLASALPSSSSIPRVPKRRASHALFQMTGPTPAIPAGTNQDSATTTTFEDATSPERNCGSITFPSSPVATSTHDGPSLNGTTSDILGSPLRVIRRGSSFIRQRAHSRQVSSVSSLGITSPGQAFDCGNPAQASPSSAIPHPQSPPLPPPIPPRSMRRSSFAQLTSPLRMRSKSVVQPKGSQKKEEGQGGIQSGSQDVGSVPSTPRKRSGSLAAVRARVMGVAGYGGGHCGGSVGGDPFLVPAVPGLVSSKGTDEEDRDRNGSGVGDVQCTSPLADG